MIAKSSLCEVFLFYFVSSSLYASSIFVKYGSEYDSEKFFEIETL